MTLSNTHQTKTYVLLFLLVLLGSVGNTILSKGMKDAGDLDLSHFSTLAAGAAHVLTSGAIWLGIAMMLGFMVCHMLVLSWADYSFVMPFSAIAYALVPLLAYLFLHEQVSDGALDGHRSDRFGRRADQPHAAPHHRSGNATLKCARLHPTLRGADRHGRRNLPDARHEATRARCTISARGPSWRSFCALCGWAGCGWPCC